VKRMHLVFCVCVCLQDETSALGFLCMCVFAG